MQIDPYDLLLDALGYSSPSLGAVNPMTTADLSRIHALIFQLYGSRKSHKTQFQLILHNDAVNNMIDIVVALYEICHLNNDDSLSVMQRAHKEGTSLIKKGYLLDLIKWSVSLRSRGIKTSFEKDKKAVTNAQ